MNLRTRIIVCICIISILISLIIFSGSLSDLRHDPQYTAFNDATATTAGVYYTENWNDSGHVYLIENSGKVISMFDSLTVNTDRVHQIDVVNGDVYVLFSAPMTEDDTTYTIYKIAQLDSKLKLNLVAENIRIDDYEIVTGFSKDDTGMHITAVAQDGSYLDVYELPLNSLKSPAVKLDTGEDKDKEIKVSDMEVADSMLFRESPAGSFFVEAEYMGSTLNVRTDHDEAKGSFQLDSRIKKAVDNISFSPLQVLKLYSKYLLYWAGGLLIWFIILFVFIYAIRRRNRVVYVLTLGELIFLIALASSFYFVKFEYEYAGTREYSRFAVLALQGELDILGDLDHVDFNSQTYFTSDDYRRIQGSMARFAEMDGNSAVFNDVFIMRLRDNAIMTGVSGRNREDATWEYGGVISDVSNDLTHHKQYSYHPIQVDGRDYVAVGVTDMDEVKPAYALVGIIASTDPNLGLWGDTKALIALFIVVFLLGSILMFIVMYMQSADLKHFEKEIRAVALGQTRVDVPATPALDMASMWNSLSEICKSIAEMNYDKFRIFEAYYRFAPKNIETIMNKDSIFDVKNGDVTKAKGTLMLVSTDTADYGPKRIKSLHNIIEYMDKYSDNKEGILVSQDSALSTLQFLFMEDSRDTTSISTQFLHRNTSDTESGFVSVFLYHSMFMYGIVGINQQSLAFITAKHSKEIEEYARWFEHLKISLVVTETVKSREPACEMRYIGYIRVGDDKRTIKLYEVLDACPARDRQLKLVNKEKFEGTLELFYSRDFYLARNRFSEILKDCPDDEITRWYLFESERYLNEPAEEASFGELRKRD